MLAGAALVLAGCYLILQKLEAYSQYVEARTRRRETLRCAIVDANA